MVLARIRNGRAEKEIEVFRVRRPPALILYFRFLPVW